MNKNDALDLIKASCSPEAAAKFHNGSRKPFDYEQPVLDVANEAARKIMAQRGTSTLFPSTEAKQSKT
jgi:hypothetical protein